MMKIIRLLSSAFMAMLFKKWWTSFVYYSLLWWHRYLKRLMHIVCLLASILISCCLQKNDPNRLFTTQCLDCKLFVYYPMFWAQRCFTKHYANCLFTIQYFRCNSIFHSTMQIVYLLSDIFNNFWNNHGKLLFTIQIFLFWMLFRGDTNNKTRYGLRTGALGRGWREARTCTSTVACNAQKQFMKNFGKKTPPKISLVKPGEF